MIIRGMNDYETQVTLGMHIPPPHQKQKEFHELSIWHFKMYVNHITQ